MASGSKFHDKFVPASAVIWTWNEPTADVLEDLFPCWWFLWEKLSEPLGDGALLEEVGY